MYDKFSKMYDKDEKFSDIKIIVDKKDVTLDSI